MDYHDTSIIIPDLRKTTLERNGADCPCLLFILQEKSYEIVEHSSQIS